MPKIETKYTDYLQETMDVMGHGGILLATQDAEGKPNAMTIGWGTIGIIWSKTIFIVLVRPSRYTYDLIEDIDDFTVNVPPPELKDEVLFCGTVSGRDHDKFAEENLTAAPGKRVKSPIIEECVIHYECKVVHNNDVIPGALLPEIVSEAYPKGDFHRLYFGEILAVYADENAEERLAK